VLQIQSGQLDAQADVSLNAPDEIRRTLDQFNLVASQFRSRFGQRIGALTHALVQHKRAIDHAVIVIELDPAGAVLYANDLHARLSGWSHARFIGRRDGWSLDIESYRGHAEQHPDSPTWKGEVVCRTAEGGTVWVRRAVVAIYNEDGAIEKYICLDIDISAEKIGELTLQQEKQRAEVTLHSIADGVITLDREQRVNYANLAAERIFAQSRERLQGQSLSRLLGADFQDRQPVAASGTTTIRNVELPGGRSAVIELSRAPLPDEQGAMSGEVLALRDVTQEHDIRTQLQRVSLAVRHAASAVLTTDRLGAIEYVNPTFTEMTGYAFDDIRGQTPRFLKSAAVPAATHAALWSAIQRGQIWRGEIINRRKDGTEFWCGLTVSVVLGADGQAVQFVSVMENISERKTAEDTIHRLAYFDSLTQLPNRRMFMEHAARAIGAAGLTARSLFTCYLDLDGFKNVNDSLGHHIGDALLAEAGQRIGDCLAPGDFVGRIGGDEFALLLPHASFESARELGRTIIQTFDAPFHIDGHEIRISTSMGVSVFPDDGREVGDLLRKADMALYKAKELGKRQLVFFTHAIETHKLERAQLENALRGALQRQELHVVYQPKVDLRTLQIVGAEALMRWRHPELGPIGPDQFIPIAEESRLIIPMGSWIIEQTCRQIRAWTDRGLHGLKVSVNISAVQFRAPDLAGDIERMLRAHGVLPSQLELEVTESGLMQDPDHVALILTTLRDIGLTVAIDDFGTGYSSLAYLKTFPVGVLKIDRSFVRDLETDRSDKGIAEAILSMAAVLGMEVVAEGVENAAQAHILEVMGCQMAQGYHFGRPMDSLQFEQAWHAARAGSAELVG